MPSTQFESKQYDTGTSLLITFTPPVGLTFDLLEAGMTAKFISRLPGSALPKVEAAAIITGAWQVRYDPIPADVNALGTFDVEVEFTRSNAKKVTMPTHGFLTWLIGPDLNNS